MAYSTFYSHDFTTLTTFFDKVCAGLVDLGWVLHDTITATDKVYKSQGEGDVFLAGYLRVYTDTDSTGSYVCFVASQFWEDGSVLAGRGKAHVVDYHLAWDSANNPLWMYGDKDFFVAYSGVEDTTFANKWVGCGFVANLLFDTKTTLTAGAISDSSIVDLTVASTAGFKEGRKYIIVGESFGRDVVTVSSIIDSTHLDVQYLDYDATIGDTIGEHPCPFGIMYDDPKKMYAVTDYYLSGETDGGSSDYFECRYPIDVADVDPSPSRDRYMLTPVLWFTKKTGYEYQLGFVNTNLLYAPVSHTVEGYHNNFYTSQRIEAGSVYSIGGSDKIIDTSKSWVVNEFTDKVVLIEGGDSAGQTRKVLSNTSTEITLDSNWFVTPIVGDIFGIYDEVYRQVGYLALKESV